MYLTKHIFYYWLLYTVVKYDGKHNKKQQAEYVNYN